VIGKQRYPGVSRKAEVMAARTDQQPLAQVAGIQPATAFGAMRRQIDDGQRRTVRRNRGKP
jgi:hypothetical protein